MSVIRVAFFADILIREFDGASHIIHELIDQIDRDNFKFRFFCGTLPKHSMNHEIEKIPYTIENITYFPVNQYFFNESLIYCKGLITGGGFETPAEALYLGKKLMSIPIAGQYEQECNAAAIKTSGARVLTNCGEDFDRHIHEWLMSPFHQKQGIANDIEKNLNYIFSLTTN
jgi:uncharacterized protein (TIGR00661 family)